MRRSSSELSLPLMIAIIVFAAIVGAAYNDKVYGDWTCMFKTCVVLRDVK